MQGLLGKSYSFSVSKVIKRQKSKNYQNHIKNMKNMTTSSCYPSSKSLKCREQIMETFYKARKSAKDFKESEQKTLRSKENRIMVGKIMKMDSDIKQIVNADKSQHQLRHSLSKDSKRKQAIKQENRRLANCIINSRVNVSEYKKKLQHEIQAYLALRKSIRKQTYISHKKIKPDRTFSQKKLTRLTLPDENLRLSEKLIGMALKNPESVRESKKSNKSDGTTLAQSKSGIKKLMEGFSEDGAALQK